MYLKPLLNQLGYKLYTQPSLDRIGYGIGIAVPDKNNDDLAVMDCNFVPYKNSQQGRGFLFVRTSKLLFVTTHLESYCGPEYTAAKEREEQIIEATRFCQAQMKMKSSTPSMLQIAIIVGDFNWDDERKQKRSVPANKKLLSILPGGWQDAGTPFDFTYDAKENPMLGGNLRRRFDRCIYLTQNGSTHVPSSTTSTTSKARSKDVRTYQSLQLQKIGMQPIPNLTWKKVNPFNGTIKACQVAPSDHFGLVISFGTK
jgi:hypothetical protein